MRGVVGQEEYVLFKNRDVCKHDHDHDIRLSVMVSSRERVLTTVTLSLEYFGHCQTHCQFARTIPAITIILHPSSSPPRGAFDHRHDGTQSFAFLEPIKMSMLSIPIAHFDVVHRRGGALQGGGAFVGSEACEWLVAAAFFEHVTQTHAQLRQQNESKQHVEATLETVLQATRQWRHLAQGKNRAVLQEQQLASTDKTGVLEEVFRLKPDEEPEEQLLEVLYFEDEQLLEVFTQRNRGCCTRWGRGSSQRRRCCSRLCACLCRWWCETVVRRTGEARASRRHRREAAAARTEKGSTFVMTCVFCMC